jgi:S1-C subfamily serine protease
MRNVRDMKARPGRAAESARLAKAKARVEAATVSFAKGGGQGVLVTGGYVLTAAHCIKWDGNGGMALGEFFIETIETRDGRTLQGSVTAAEPVADIAALGAPDGRVGMYEAAKAFDRFTAETQGVPLFTWGREVGKPIPVQVFTHKQKWLAGTVEPDGFPGTPGGGAVCIMTNERIESGTSGSPVIDSRGRLVGVVTWSRGNDRDGEHPGKIAVASLALPRWLLDRITDPMQ